MSKPFSTAGRLGQARRPRSLAARWVRPVLLALGLIFGYGAAVANDMYLNIDRNTDYQPPARSA